MINGQGHNTRKGKNRNGRTTTNSLLTSSQRKKAERQIEYIKKWDNNKKSLQQ